MSAFNNNSVTLKGAAIIASLVTGSTLTFTRIAVGDGTLASGQTALTRERLVNPLFNVPISSVENRTTQAVVKGTFSNVDLNTGFYYREIGLFAINPDTNAEELFLYGNAGTEAEWINPAGQSSLIEKEIHLVTLIGNASNVTAVFDENAKVLKSEFDAIVPFKADLDAKPENGGRVVASQMRFDEVQNLYVDAAAATGGDGTQAKPFKTIAAAVAAYYPGARNVIIRIKPGTYPENIEINYASGSYWQILRDGTGNVVINSLSSHGILLYLKDLSFTGSVTNIGVLAANCPVVTMDNITVNGNANVNGLQFYNTATFLSNVKINSCANAVVARDNSRITVNGISGTGNVVGVFSGESIVTINSNTIQANTPYTRINGGTIDPASWQIIDDSKTSINTLPSGLYSLKNAKVEQGLPENYDGTLLVDQSTGTPHMIYFYDGENRMFHRSYDKQGGYWREWEDYIPETPTASASTFGLIRTTSVEDEQNCQCNDAAVTPASLYDLSDYRKANQYYNVGDVVAVPYHANLYMECIAAGRTDSSALDTTSAYDGQQIIDGGATWEVGLIGAIPGSIMMLGYDEAIPVGYVDASGAEVSRITYARLFRKYGTRYGAGNDSTTFNLPNLNNNSFLEGSNTAGTVKEAGLPDIQASAYTANPASAGAFYDMVAGAFTHESGALAAVVPQGGFKTSDPTAVLRFEAHLYSPIYGNSYTVQPKSVTVKFCIKY